MSDSAITTAAATTATSNPASQLSETTLELETARAPASAPPQPVPPKDTNDDAEEDLHEELKKRVVESLEAHRIASEATVKMLQRNVELEASSLGNLSGGDSGNVSTRPDLFCDFN
ncbi:uncharacterized protein ARMOST_21004 [Armillaria ostoyae]|uniref:Uncharacterized protein n=1 Tax=Armillaria ostoyae TaxID=47428 RepID=A0A284S8X7_ARMOS|nr:uncharacterized protein ARMOST_21004 [Armillaria ostoyae]